MRQLPILLVLLFSVEVSAQQVLLNEDFEVPTNVFTLNTTDVSSSTGGANTWLVNDVYAGGNGLADCLGFEIPFTIPTTAGQPAGVSSANGYYMHTASTQAINSGVLCCSFGAADGFCTDPGNHFTRMSTDVSTLGLSNITLSFWWICQGGSANYGEVYYSIDGGTNWTLVSTPIAQYRNSSVWVQQSITLPAFAEQATLRFGFRFVNGTAFSAADPGFGLDDIRITAEGAIPATVSTGAMPNTAYCEGASFALPYTAEGQFGAGNTFSVELSDASGDFSAPLTIGSVVSGTSGSITCMLPMGFEAGSGYRVRVVSSTPAVIGDPNALDIAISIPPSAGEGNTVQACSSDAAFSLFEALEGTPDDCGTWSGPSPVLGGMFDPGTMAAGLYVYTTNCPGPCPQDQATVTVSLFSAANAGADVQADICGDDAGFSPYQYLDGGSTTGQFFYEGQPFPLPDFSVPGTYGLDYVVAGTSQCPADSATLVFTVIAPANAGTSLNYTLCINDDPVELFSLLGNADEGGEWTDPSGGPFNGTLVPATGQSGLYTYTVTGEEPCGDAQSFVALVIDPCAGIGEHGVGSLQLEWGGQVGSEQVIVLDVEDRVRMVQVFDAVGRSIIDPVFTQQSGRVNVDLSTAAAGLYSLVVTMDDHRIGTVRVYQQR
ncbi:MAG: choice-of-anchor J domain-containing protein [Flavobacteriales bacterium]|nr:choice-of-anchor J domain-containing protein [Flavobacteriales bacterium]